MTPLQEVMEAVDDAVEEMDREEYKEFLEELIGDLQIRLDAVEEELKDEG